MLVRSDLAILIAIENVATKVFFLCANHKHSQTTKMSSVVQHIDSCLAADQQCKFRVALAKMVKSLGTKDVAACEHVADGGLANVSNSRSRSPGCRATASQWAFAPGCEDVFWM